MEKACVGKLTDVGDVVYCKHGLIRLVGWAATLNPKAPCAKVWLDRSEGRHGWGRWATSVNSKGPHAKVWLNGSKGCGGWGWWATSVNPKSPRAKVWLDRSEGPHGWRWWAMPQIPACQGLARRVKGALWLAIVDQAWLDGCSG